MGSEARRATERLRQAGFAASVELLVLASLVAALMVIAWGAVGPKLCGELGDLAGAIDALDQGFRMGGVEVAHPPPPVTLRSGGAVTRAIEVPPAVAGAAGSGFVDGPGLGPVVLGFVGARGDDPGVPGDPGGEDSDSGNDPGGDSDGGGDSDSGGDSGDSDSSGDSGDSDSGDGDSDSSGDGEDSDSGGDSGDSDSADSDSGGDGDSGDGDFGDGSESGGRRSRAVRLSAVGFGP